MTRKQTKERLKRKQAQLAAENAPPASALNISKRNLEVPELEMPEVPEREVPEQQLELPTPKNEAPTGEHANPEPLYKVLLAELERKLIDAKPQDPIKFLESYLRHNYENLIKPFKDNEIHYSKPREEAPNMQVTNIVDLPKNVLENIIAYLPTLQLIKLSTVHSTFYSLINDPTLWKYRFAKKCYENITYISSDWPIWKIKYIQNFKKLPAQLFYTLESTFIATGRVEEIIKPSEMFPSALLRVYTMAVLYREDNANPPIPEIYNEEIIYPVSRYSLEETKLYDELVFGIKMDTYWYGGHDKTQAILSNSVAPHIPNGYTFPVAAAKTISSCRYTLESIKKMAKAQTLVGRLKNIFSDYASELHAEFSLKYETRLCESCKNRFQDVAYIHPKDRKFICIKCKAKPMHINGPYSLEREPELKCPFVVTELIFQRVADFVKSEILLFVAKVKMEFITQQEVVKKSTLIQGTFRIYHSSYKEDDFSTSEKSVLLIYLTDDGIVRSFTLLGDIAKKLSEIPSNENTDPPNFDIDQYFVNKLNIRYENVSDALISVKAFSQGSGKSWCRGETFKLGERELTITTVHTYPYAILSYVNNWPHRSGVVENYHLFPSGNAIDEYWR